MENIEDVVSEVMDFFGTVREMACADPCEFAGNTLKKIHVLPDLSPEAQKIVAAFLQDHPEEHKIREMVVGELTFYPGETIAYVPKTELTKAIDELVGGFRELTDRITRTKK